MRPFRVLERVSKTLCIFHSFIEMCFLPCSGAVDVALSKITVTPALGELALPQGPDKEETG